MYRYPHRSTYSPMADFVKPKKALGQHFLIDLSVAERIANTLTGERTKPTLEIGPGTGVLTKFLVQRPELDLSAIEIDVESVAYLKKHKILPTEKILSADFLHTNLDSFANGQPFNVIGNFPYNISTQIFFKVIDMKDRVPEVVGMLQKEVAERLASGPGTKDYGILSVLLQAWYHIEYCFTVGAEVFDPPPKVQSGVIRMVRNDVTDLGVSEKLFKQVVKGAFNQRRKMLSNSLKAVVPPNKGLDTLPYLSKRPEQLGVQEFIELTRAIEDLK